MLPLLRFTTAGSVDDGKSTLIGRLLHDSRSVYEDQLAAAHRGAGVDAALDLALLTDGLRAEREQGITIDVAYRYFSTPRRTFILADTPGHEQYTRNMATGASTAEAAVILLDASRPLQPQARRHAAIARLLGIRHLVAAINKMDLVGYNQAAFTALAGEFLEFARRLGWAQIYALPVSALQGDNVVEPSRHMPWHAGPPLLAYLEELDLAALAPPEAAKPFRFPVQLVLRLPEGGRGLAGQVVSGEARAGDEIRVWPAGLSARIARIGDATGTLACARAGAAVTLELDRELDAGRGDLLAPDSAAPQVADTLRVSLVWMDDAPSHPGKLYWLQHGARTLRCRIARLEHRLNLETLAPSPVCQLNPNDIGQAVLALRAPVAFDPYEDIRARGACILVDPETHVTAAAGMILGAAAAGDAEPGAELARRWGHPAAAIWFERRPAAAGALVTALRGRQWNVVRVPAAGFDPDALAAIAAALSDAGAVAVFDAASPPPPWSGLISAPAIENADELQAHLLACLAPEVSAI